MSHPLKQLAKSLLPDWAVQKYRDNEYQRHLPAAAKAQDALDRQGLPDNDPGNERAISACLAWLARAQDHSATNDGGVARDFSLIKGWAPSYPETTGYIVPTMLAEAALQNDETLKNRALRMLDWLVDIQLEGGGFQGGLVTATPVVPVTFNTGQILIGLAAGAKETGNPSYLQAMHRAAEWLSHTQDEDGCWRKHPTPFAKPGEKAYETHVSWGLFEAERVAPGHDYGEAGLKQVRWALTKQEPNGWFRDCCLSNPAEPLTHTIGYVLRGVLEAWRLSASKEFLDAAIRTADALIPNAREDGFLAGRFDSQWQPAVNWSCLTGSVQIAYCWLYLHELTGEERYLQTARSVNSYVRRTIAMDGNPDQMGGVRGSYPISGSYGKYEYLNWAAKFAIDAFRQEALFAKQ